jgi:hypothetical protein
MCNVSGSMGQQHWYRLAAALPSPMDFVQVELWDNTGTQCNEPVNVSVFWSRIVPAAPLAVQP